MASDSLNEIGRYIKDTNNRATDALNRVRPNRPAVERTRDIFDPAIPFSMEFNKSSKQRSVTLDLTFNKPPPMQNCMTGGNIRMSCEEFTVTSGDHELKLTNAYMPGTTSVYVNGSAWPTFKYAEEDWESGEVLITDLTNEVNTVTICYMRHFTQGLCLSPTPSCFYPPLHTIQGGFILGILQEARSDEFGYIHYLRPGVSHATVPSPFAWGGTNWSENYVSGSADGIGCRGENTVRFIAVGSGTATIFTPTGRGNGYDVWYDIIVWRPGVGQIQSYQNILCGDEPPQIHIEVSSENQCVTYIDLTGWDTDFPTSQIPLYSIRGGFGGVLWESTA
jgi:hypothetical protein